MLATTNSRQVVVDYLKQELGEVSEANIRAAVICGEMGCSDAMKEFVVNNPDLKCPYVEMADGPERCSKLREKYLAAIGQ